MGRNMLVRWAGLVMTGALAFGMGTCAKAADAPDTDSVRFETDDGHVYFLVKSDCTWTEALDRADNAGGYLVNIDGWTEYSTILHKIIDAGMSDIRFRIGASRSLDSRDYHWVDGENVPHGAKINDPSYWSWSRWITGGPSFYANGCDEDVLEIMYYEKENRWVWNDVPDDIVGSSSWFSGRVGYIVEFDQESEGYGDAYLGWEQLDAGDYDPAYNGGSYDELTQSGYTTYDEENQAGYATYDEQYQGGDGPTAHEGTGDVHLPGSLGNDPSELLSLVPDFFNYSSGAGAWGTDLTLYDDGSFEGVYHDWNAGEDMELYAGGTEYLCVFTGRFKNFRRVDRYTWAMDLDRLSYESEVGDNWLDVRDQIHYVASEAFGIYGGDTFYLYLKGHPEDTLPEEFVNWSSSYYDTAESGGSLPIFGIYNETTGAAFGSQ